MKKNISINIGGIIFHIEEDGYERLRKYLDSVNKYFASFEDSSEILADIEGRIAEIFLAKLNEGKQVITAEDVTSLIGTMGSVSDFKAAEEQEFEAAEPASRKSQQQTPPPGGKSPRLVRDENRKILGGVCAGLGYYFNVDPVWPRLLLALLTLGTSGVFLLVYIVMWIVLPAETLEDQPAVKKMYRDPDKKVLGGVAAGVAVFFGTDLSLIRLLFVIFGLFGLGIAAYIILWIVLPEAKTITDKMQMQGEPLTLSNIESSVKKNLNEKGEEEESVLTKIILFPFRAIAALLNLLAPVFRVLVDVFRVGFGLVTTLIGVVLMICILLMVGVLAGLFSPPEWNFFADWYTGTPNLPINAIRNSFPSWTILVAFLAAVIPAIFMVLLGSSIIARRIIFNTTAGWSLFVIFFLSITVIGFSIPRFVYSFKEDGEYKVEQQFEIGKSTPVLSIHEIGLDDYDVTSLFLKGYNGTQIKVVERFQSQGPSRKVAAENAHMIDYQIVQKDSVITFDSNITFREDAMFRAQRIDVDVFIPYNQVFVVEPGLWRVIDTQFMDGNYFSFRFSDETQRWKLTEQGLECVTCPSSSSESAPPGSDQFGFKNFNSLELKGLFDVKVVKGENYSVEMEGPFSERDRYDVYIDGETLVINYKNRNKSFWKGDYISDKEMRIRITMPALRELEVLGAGKLKFRGFDEDELDVKLTGAMVAEGQIQAKTLNVDLTGASFLDLNGGGSLLEANLMGASGLRAYGYEVGHCIVEAHGASNARVNVRDVLEIKKGMASSVSHRGNPQVIKR